MIKPKKEEERGNYKKRSESVSRMTSPAGGDKKRKLRREELAVLLSVVATVVVIVQQFLTDNDLLLLPSQTMALEASVQATTLALTKLQMMFSLAKAVSIVEDQESDNVGPSTIKDRDRDRDRNRDINTCWFRRFTSSVTDDKTWRENFRMSKRSFDALVDELRPALGRTGEEETPPAEHQLGAALYRLAHGATFKSAGRKFGIRTSAACKAFYTVCRALEDRLRHLCEFPSTAEALFAVVDGFAEREMPNCCGVIGYTRFLLDPPPATCAAPQAEDYRDAQGSYGVIMQCLVDSRGRFLDISVGWAGSYTAPTILPGTRLYARVETSQELLNGPAVELINGVPMPQYIIGDSSCPLYSWLLTPYRLQPLTPAQELYNSVHEYVRSAIWRAFDALKSQWQLLAVRQRWENAEFLPRIVIAACVLQNFLVQAGEPMPDVQDFVANDFPVADERNEVGESIRDALAAHIAMVAQMRAQL